MMDRCQITARHHASTLHDALSKIPFLLHVKPVAMWFWMKVILCAFCLLATEAQAQSIEGFHFERYGVQRSRSKFKHKVDLQSNPTAWDYRTRITQGYHEGKIDFAGHYITVIWGCGSGCIAGAMVDTRDGRVYDLPSGEDRAYVALCRDDESTYGFEDERMMYRPDSRLFVTSTCMDEKISESNRYRDNKVLYIHIWNERNKEFELVRTVEKSIDYELED